MLLIPALPAPSALTASDPPELPAALRLPQLNIGIEDCKRALLAAPKLKIKPETVT